MRKFNFLAILALFMLAISAPASAEDGIAAMLGDIEWGDSRQDVVEKLRTQMLAELRNDERLRNDRVAMQRERQRALDRARAVEDSHTQLQGARTGYEVSIIAGEFKKDNREELLRVRDEMAQRYYLFVDGKLYRVVVAYNRDYVANVGFETFLSQASRRYGRPVSTDYGEIFGEEVLVRARWEDGSSELRVEDKREFFGTFAMVFSDRQMISQLRSANRLASSEEQGQGEVSERVRALQRSESVDRHAGAVDSLLGGDTTVDLSAGRPDYSEEDAAAAEAQARAEAEARAEREREERKKKKKKKKRRQPRNDFSDLEAGGGDDLIIY
ncbi:hypothetical protein DL240_04850 [Lujinxingia litoralis]|uniref:Uncharacterized protein n=1 Tax=Lujinxingia litoralis TaxID=2211119 RepID=A0A328C6M7_9DELT|nr:hypothetical protein [Lujinxingia litoralis]RAL23493.1 hypothetical protein DL240_04850 [Lujinxingia litoralis]